MANRKSLFEKKWNMGPEKIEDEIHRACGKNETQKVTNLLIQRRKEINPKLLDAKGSLFEAISHDNLLIVEGLLKIGCDPNVTTSDRQPALFIAFVNGNMCIVRSLLHYGAYIGNTLLFAIEEDASNIVEKILKFQVEIDKVDLEYKGYKGFNFRYKELPPLHLAINKRNLEIVKLLLKHKANPNRTNIRGDTPLFIAVSRGYIEIVKELLNHGAAVDVPSGIDEIPFWRALMARRFEIAKILLDHGANIDYRHSLGRTSLHDAASDGNLENVEFLLEHNANINAVDFYKDTPLHIATENSHTEVVKKLLINDGNDIKIRNIEGNTALESAVASTNIKVLKMISFHDNN